MRRIGLVPSELVGERFCDYLLARGVQAIVRSDAEGVGVWVRKENDRDVAQTEFDRYQKNPEAFDFDAAAKAAAKVRAEDRKTERAFQKRVKTGIQPSRQPITRFLVIASSVLFVAIWLDGAPLLQLFAYSRDPAGQAAEIRRGEIWRVFTPVFIHFSILHIFFNMSWLWNLGGQVERYCIRWRYVLLIAILAAVANTASYFYDPAPERISTLSGGMSGVVFGLLGFVLVAREIEPMAELIVSPENILWMAIWLVLGITGIVAAMFGINIDNVAHVTGLIAGMACGVFPRLWRR